MKLSLLSSYIGLLFFNLHVLVYGAGGAVSGPKAGIGEFEPWSQPVYYNPHNLTVTEGKTLRITCKLARSEYLKWMHNGTQLPIGENGISAGIHESNGFVTSILSIENAKKENSGEYKCTTFSPLFITVFIVRAIEKEGNSCPTGGGVSSGQQCWINLLSTSSDTENIKFLRENHPLLMECNIKKDLHELKWFKNNEEISPDDEHYKIRQNSTLYIASAKMDDVGVYRCQTVNKSPVQSFNVSIIYLAFKKLPKSITVLQGDKLSIACEVEGNPMPTIKWAKENVDVKEAINESRYHLEANDKHTENATFIINEAEYGDRANYVCFITSAGINYNTTTYVRVKDMYAALWPFLGICVEVFILCLIIFIYEKRRAKAEFEESDTDQPIEQKNKSDQNKDVRQRK